MIAKATQMASDTKEGKAKALSKAEKDEEKKNYKFQSPISQ